VHRKLGDFAIEEPPHRVEESHPDIPTQFSRDPTLPNCHPERSEGPLHFAV